MRTRRGNEQRCEDHTHIYEVARRHILSASLTGNPFDFDYQQELLNQGLKCSVAKYKRQLLRHLNMRRRGDIHLFDSFLLEVEDVDISWIFNDIPVEFNSYLPPPALCAAIALTPVEYSESEVNPVVIESKRNEQCMNTTPTVDSELELSIEHCKKPHSQYCETVSASNITSDPKYTYIHHLTDVCRIELYEANYQLRFHAGEEGVEYLVRYQNKLEELHYKTRNLPVLLMMLQSYQDPGTIHCATTSRLPYGCLSLCKPGTTIGYVCAINYPVRYVVYKLTETAIVELMYELQNKPPEYYRFTRRKYPDWFDAGNISDTSTWLCG